MQDELEDHIESELVPSGVKIHQLVDLSFKAVGISKVRMTSVLPPPDQ